MPRARKTCRERRAAEAETSAITIQRRDLRRASTLARISSSKSGSIASMASTSVAIAG